MPDIDHFQANLLHIRRLLFPPLVADMVHEFAALDPRGAIPLEILSNPVLMNTRVHTVLHLQHIEDGISIHVSGKQLTTKKIVAWRKDHTVASRATLDDR